MWPPRGSVGERISPRLRRRAWCLSTRPARPPTWHGPAAAQCAASGSSGGCRTAIGRSPPSLRGCAAARTAPFVIDEPMNGVIFLAYVRRCLAPTLARGDIVILDNLKPHKAAGVREAIEAAGATLR